MLLLRVQWSNRWVLAAEPVTWRVWLESPLRQSMCNKLQQVLHT